jgi:AraC-like DNA-binding protein
MRLMWSTTLVLQGAPITQVELSSGYESQSAHAVAFKKHFGISASGFWRSAQRLAS